MPRNPTGKKAPKKRKLAPPNPTSKPPIPMKKSRDHQKAPSKAICLCNGNADEDASFFLTEMEAKLSSVLRARLGEDSPSLELEGASNQNIEDLGTFFVTAAHAHQVDDNKEIKFVLRYPVRSQDACDTILEPTWAASLTNQFTLTNTVSSLLVLLYCATGLRLPSLEQICLVGLAIKLKGKTMADIQDL